MTVWGNHSNTMYPWLEEARINQKPVTMTDEERADFEKEVQGRGAAIIAECGKSSAASAANAACDHMRSWWFKTDKVYSMGVIIPEGGLESLGEADASGLCFSIACKTDENGKWTPASFESKPNQEGIQRNIDALN